MDGTDGFPAIRGCRRTPHTWYFDKRFAICGQLQLRSRRFASVSRILRTVDFLGVSTGPKPPKGVNGTLRFF